MQKRIWVIDDEQAICWALKRAMEQAGYSAITFSNAKDALAELTESSQFDAVMLDMRMPGMDGLTAAAAFKKLRPRVPVIMMTAFGDLSSAMDAMDLDVFEYLTKPFDLADGLKAIAKAIASTSTPATKGGAESILNETLLGSSPAMQRVYKQVALASRSDVPVLISGPIGIDKEYVASTIHRSGPRQSSPFLAFVPTAISPIAVASEFLGSLQSPSSRAGGTFFRSGAVELAGDGTLYVDEVSDLPLSLQAQLLRVLEHKKYNRLGDATSRACSARVLVSTSRNLRTVVAEGEFLEELRQRLDVFTIELVALSERRDDILPLAVAFLKTHAADRELGFTEDAVKWLISGAWPGNVRELRSVIDRAVVSSRGRWIDVEDLADADGLLPSTLPGIATDLADAIRRWTLTHLDKLGEKDLRIQDTQSEDAFGCMYEDFLSTVERPMLQSMMEAFHHNRALIATQLGMHRSTLRQKMRRYEID